MSRVKGSTPTRDRRKKVLKAAKGYFGSKHLLYRTAHEQVMHSWRYSWIDRRQLKREMRKLWIARINAAAKMNGMNYSTLMHGLKTAGVNMNRKMLSEIAISNPEDFAKICETAKAGKVVSAAKVTKTAENSETVTEEKKAAPKKAAAPKKEAAEKKPAAKKPAAKKPATKKEAE